MAQHPLAGDGAVAREYGLADGEMFLVGPRAEAGISCPGHACMESAAGLARPGHVGLKQYLHVTSDVAHPE